MPDASPVVPEHPLDRVQQALNTNLDRRVRRAFRLPFKVHRSVMFALAILHLLCGACNSVKGTGSQKKMLRRLKAEAIIS